MSAEFIPHMGYVEMPNPVSSSTRINLRITGCGDGYIYMNKAHLDTWTLKNMQGLGINEWENGLEGEPKIPGQFRLPMSGEMNVRMLEMHERILPNREPVEASQQDIGPSQKVVRMREAS